MRTKKRVDKKPVFQNRPDRRKGGKPDFQFNVVESNDDFLRFFIALDKHFASHNFFGLKPFLDDGLRGFAFASDHGSSTVKFCNHILIEDPLLCRIVFIPSSKGCIELYKIEVYNKNQGIGSTLMNAFKVVSTQTGVKICLIPADPTSGQYSGAHHHKMRRDFYHRLGFKRSPVSEYWTN